MSKRYIGHYKQVEYISITTFYVHGWRKVNDSENICMLKGIKESFNVLDKNDYIEVSAS